MDSNDAQLSVANELSILAIDPCGGAFLDFHLKSNPVNPLAFRSENEGLPRRGGFQGHFLCLGRWGDPMKGERSLGIPKHGEICRIPWEFTIMRDALKVIMKAKSPQELLKIERAVTLHPFYPVAKVRETVCNEANLGRFYQLVQHPTFAAPFLNNDVLVFCNGGIGFNQMFNGNPESNALHWPYAYTEDERILKLNRFDSPYNGVFSFVVDTQSSQGWLAIYSRKYRLIMGYVWSREQYPWINMWQHWEGRQLTCLGLEFGTTGLYKPFSQIVEEQHTRLFGERTYAFIDGGERVRYDYHMFLYRVNKPLEKLESLRLTEEELVLGIDGREERMTLGMG